jgi:hypothetical protein
MMMMIIVAAAFSGRVVEAWTWARGKPCSYYYYWYDLLCCLDNDGAYSLLSRHDGDTSYTIVS